jgi:hypothetical protein
MTEMETSAEALLWNFAASNGMAALLQRPLRLLQLREERGEEKREEWESEASVRS